MKYKNKDGIELSYTGNDVQTKLVKEVISEAIAILDKRFYANLFQKAEKKSYEEMKIPESSDYSRYEVILPKEFQVPQVKYVDQRPTLGLVLPPDFRKEDSIFQGEGLPGFTPRDPINDCQGKWGEWDDDLCSDNRNRCALKFREYKV